jgi:hypothetical protein
VFNIPHNRPPSQDVFGFFFCFFSFFPTEEEKMEKDNFLKNNFLYIIGIWEKCYTFAPAFAM